MSAKVRIACRRCRTKRIKCDGGVPACSNCSKANEVCIDVDGRNKTLSIPRDFAANAQARIGWLEENIQLLSPDFNLGDGPRVDFGFLERTEAVPTPHLQENPQPAEPWRPGLSDSYKRAFTSIADDASHESFTDKARSVALNLGLLSLNSDSRQTHYLGTSSGRLFTSLIGATSPDSSISASHSMASKSFTVSSSSRIRPTSQTSSSSESCHSLYQTLRNNLPPVEDAQILMEGYLRDVHVDHPFMHPKSLESAIKALYQCAESQNRPAIDYNGWTPDIEQFAYNGEFDVSAQDQRIPISVFTATFHVFMVFTLAATVRTRQRLYDFAPHQFYRIAMSVGQRCFSETSLSSLQGILLLAVYSLLSPAELNIWTLTYVAMAHSIDLGLHRSPGPASPLTTQALLIRKMVFFSVYHLDRSIATIQGRPLGMRDESFDLELPTFAEMEDNFNTGDNADRHSPLSLKGGLAYAIHRFKLDPIISEIKLIFYHLPSRVNTYSWPRDYHTEQIAIKCKLEEWRDGIFRIADTFDDASENDKLEIQRYGLKLMSQYFAAMILLYQPSQTMQQPDEHALMVCYQCAASRLNTYNDMQSSDMLYLSWRSVQGIFSSGATMIYCLWTSTSIRNSVTMAEAIKDLRTCTNLLSLGGQWWPSVQKGKDSFVRAMDALLKTLDLSQKSIGDDGRPSVRRRLFADRVQNDMSSSHHAVGRGRHPIDPQIYQSNTGDHIQNSEIPSAFASTDWTILNDPGFHHCAADIPDEYLQDGSDLAVESFIAEFWDNETSWNLF